LPIGPRAWNRSKDEVSDGPDTKRCFSDFARAIPPPYGYDPAQLFGESDDPRFGVLKLTATRSVHCLVVD
jgi:hypothetical protein